MLITVGGSEMPCMVLGGTRCASRGQPRQPFACLRFPLQGVVVGGGVDVVVVGVDIVVLGVVLMMLACYNLIS